MERGDSSRSRDLTKESPAGRGELSEREGVESQRKQGGADERSQESAPSRRPGQQHCGRNRWIGFKIGGGEGG